MNTTTNLGLKKPQKAAGDPIDIDVLNDNSDIIDSFAGEINTALASKQDALSQSQLAAANSGITAEKLTADEAAIAEVVDNGAKNKLHYDGISAPSGDTTNISFSYNGDSITITGSTSSNAAWCYLTLNGSIVVANEFCNGKYFLSSERSGSGNVDVFAYEVGVGQFADDSGNGVVIPNKATSNSVRLMVSIPKGATVSITLKIMICTKAAWDVSHIYEPYALSNPVITPALIEQVDNGVKNFVQLGFTSTSGSSSVPATTNNNDGTITVNGSRVGNATILVQDLVAAQTSSVNTRYTLPAGSYVIAPTGNANIGLQVYKHNGTNLVGLGNAKSEALSFTYSDTDKVQYPYICIRLFCEGNSTINNFTFMPMVCTKAAWDVSHEYQPYAPTNRELYEMILALQNGTRSAPALAKSAEPEETEPETGEKGKEER